MRSPTRVDGIEETLRALNREVGVIEGKTRKGLLAAALKLRARSQQEVPHRLGDLIRSAYSRLTPEDPNVAEVGYNISYALFVHEMRMVYPGEPRPAPYPGVRWGPQGKPKFLEDPLNAMTQEIIDTIAQYIRE